jgi:hypothetical protein
MAFINEFISEADFEKYGISAINQQWCKLDFRSHWTIDRERDVYVREVASDREEFGRHKKYTLYWKGTLIIEKLEVHGAVNLMDVGNPHYKLLSIGIPHVLAGKRAEILQDLKEALTVFGGGGVHATETIANVTFDF